MLSDEEVLNRISERLEELMESERVKAEVPDISLQKGISPAPGFTQSLI